MNGATSKGTASFVVGLSLIATAGAVAVGPCCMWNYTIREGVGESGDPCTGNSVQSCEESTGTAQSPAFQRGFTLRLAVCTNYKSVGTVVQAACDANIPGWQIVPGTLGENKCCWVQTAGLTTTAFVRDFQIQPCGGGSC